MSEANENEMDFETAEKISDYIFLDSRRYDSQMRGE